MRLPRLSSAALAWGALVVVYVVWGSTYLAIRVSVRTLPPGVLGGLRYLIAGVIMYPLALRTGTADERAHDRPGWRQWGGCAVVSVLLLVIGNGGVMIGERTLASGLAAVLVATVPLWMVVFGALIARQRIRWPAGVGLALGLAGVAVLADGGPLRGDATGVAVVLTAAAAWGLGSVLSHRVSLPRRILLATAIEMLIGGALMAAIAAVDGQFDGLRWSSVTFTEWFAVVWLILLGSILAFTAYGYCLAHLPLLTVSTYAYVNPVVAVALGALLLGESLSGREAVGAVLVVGSVALSLWRPRRRSPTRAEVPVVEAPPVGAPAVGMLAPAVRCDGPLRDGG